MGVKVQYLKLRQDNQSATMRYRDNGSVSKVTWLFNTDEPIKDFDNGRFSNDISILLADNFLDDVESMTKQAYTELVRIQPIVKQIMESETN
jgi:hypothetical protein